MADDVDELIVVWRNMVKVLNESATAAIDQSEAAWTSANDGTYDTSAATKDSAQAYARSVNTWRKMAKEWTA